MILRLCITDLTFNTVTFISVILRDNGFYLYLVENLVGNYQSFKVFLSMCTYNRN